MPMQGGGAGVALAWAMVAFTLAVSAVISYFLGCVNGAVIISKYVLKDDIRTHGSGNAGLTNFYRTFGGKLTAAVLALDIVKMVLAVLLSMAAPSFTLSLYASVIGAWEMPHTWLLFLKYWAGMWCVIGHMYPCMFGFKGGKGILSGGTLILLLDWRVALVGWGGFLLLAALTRYVSLGSVWAGASFPFSTWLVYGDWRLVLMAAVVGALIVWKHRGNIQRILKGEERKFSLHRKKDQ